MAGLADRTTFGGISFGHVAFAASFGTYADNTTPGVTIHGSYVTVAGNTWGFPVGGDLVIGAKGQNAHAFSGWGWAIGFAFGPGAGVVGTVNGMTPGRAAGVQAGPGLSFTLGPTYTILTPEGVLFSPAKQAELDKVVDPNKGLDIGAIQKETTIATVADPNRDLGLGQIERDIAIANVADPNRDLDLGQIEREIATAGWDNGVAAAGHNPGFNGLEGSEPGGDSQSENSTTDPNSGTAGGLNGVEGAGNPDGPSGMGYDKGGGDIQPVILDLTGTGITITARDQSNVFFDTAGDGYKHRTAWAGAGNGVLAIDANGDGQITERNEIAFTDWDAAAASDLEAIRTVFDTNNNGLLDAGDARWSSFRIVVTNADGTTSVKTLTELGIQSITHTANTTASALREGGRIARHALFTRTHSEIDTVAMGCLPARPNRSAKEACVSRP